jgi:cytochrome c-type biogenesis protein CcmH/NrfG
LYACRGLYQLQEYALVVEGLSHCLRHEKTMKEAQHLLAFSLLHTKQNKLAAAAFFKSIKLGNETDWQPLVELCIEQPKLKLSVAGGNAAAAIITATGGH